jgi:hypothetical protein
MANYERARDLRLYIKELYSELATIDPNQSNLTAAQYLEMKTKLKNVTNLIAIARNELRAVTHLYKLKLIGDIENKSGELIKKTLKEKVFTEIDCQLLSHRRLKLSNRFHKPMLDFIKANYSDKFFEGRYEIKSIVQLT